MYHFELIAGAEKEARIWAKKMCDRPEVDGDPGWLHGAAEVYQMLHRFATVMDSPKYQGTPYVQMKVTQQALTKSNAMVRELMIRAAKKGGYDERAWVDIMLDDDLNAYMHVFNQGIDVLQQSQTTQLNQVWSNLNFDRFGKKVYEVSSGLGDQLLHTELRGLSTEDLQVPYEALYLIFPKDFPYQVWNSQSGWHQIEGVYIVEDPFAIPKMGSDQAAKEAASDGTPRIRCWRFFVVGASKNPDDPFDDALYHYGVRLPPEMSLEDALDKHEQDEWDSGKIPLAEPMRKIWRPMFKFILNAMLYATWPDAEVDHVHVDKEAAALWRRLQKAKGTKRKKIAARLKERSQTRVHILGQSIRVDRTKEASGGQGGSGSPLVVRTRVPGHWQRYWTGPGRTIPKRIFKKPFWRGPEEGVLSNPKRELGRKETQ